MCNQTVSLAAAEIERAGIPTTVIVYLREAAEKLRPPRALWVPFPHGYALGKPGEPELQLSVLRQALALLGEEGPGPILRDFVPAALEVSAVAESLRPT